MRMGRCWSSVPSVLRCAFFDFVCIPVFLLCQHPQHPFPPTEIPAFLLCQHPNTPPSHESLQFVEDFASHVASYHATTNIHLRCIPCPLGCGTVLTPRYNDAKMPQWQLDVHTYGDACKARVLLLEAAKRECEGYVSRRAGVDAAAAYAEERGTWGW